MKKYFILLAICLLLIEVFSLLPKKYFPIDKKDLAPLHAVSGVTHVHSTYSDGGGTIEEIAESANKAGLDFVIITDHNDSRSRKEQKEKIYGNTDVFIEMEASSTPGHTIIFFSETPYVNLNDLAITFKSDDRLFLKEVDPDFFSIVAHPSNLKMPWKGKEEYIQDGLEVFNLDSMWQRNVVDSIPHFMVTAFFYALNPYVGYSRVLDTYGPDFNLWDRLNQKKWGHFATFGHDTHSLVKLSDSFKFRWPSYLNNFRVASNVVLLKEPAKADFISRKKQIYHSIREGRLVVNFQLYYPFHNIWKIECPKNTYYSGDHVKESHCKHVFELPADFPYTADILLNKNGRKMAEWSNVKKVEQEVSGKGFYRAEIWISLKTRFAIGLDRKVPYQFYNPIYVH